MTIRQHRREVSSTLREVRRSNTKVERIMLLLIESGLIYCLSGVRSNHLSYDKILNKEFQVVVLISVFVRLPSGTLGDIYHPVHVQVAVCFHDNIVVLRCYNFYSREFIQRLYSCWSVKSAHTRNIPILVGI